MIRNIFIFIVQINCEEFKIVEGTVLLIPVTRYLGMQVSFQLNHGTKSKKTKAICKISGMKRKLPSSVRLQDPLLPPLLQLRHQLGRS